MGFPANVEKNKLIVLLKQAGMPMNEIVRAFNETDKRNFYRVWHRDKGKYSLKEFVVPILLRKVGKLNQSQTQK